MLMSPGAPLMMERLPAARLDQGPRASLLPGSDAASSHQRPIQNSKLDRLREVIIEGVL